MDVQEIQLDYEKKISDLEYNIMQHQRHRSGKIKKEAGTCQYTLC